MRYLILLLCLHAGVSFAGPRVVTSIVPLQEIASSLMEGTGAVEVIIGGDGSAHHFSFKPSHVRRLQQADLVIWLDDHFESGFHDIAETLPDSTRQLQLIPKMSLEIDDGHVWYSASLVAEMTKLIGQALEEIDPDNREIYRENRQSLLKALSEWREATLRNGLPPVDKIVNEHDFSIHFTNDFGLQSIPSVHDDHHDHGGLSELGSLEQSLRERDSNCLLAFSDTPVPLAKRLMEKYDLRLVNLNAIAPAQSGDPAIVARLQQLLMALEACSV